MVRSYLYVPGDHPERFANALASGADAVVFDLEDSVPIDAKDKALVSVCDFLRTASTEGAETWARINGGTRGDADLRALTSLRSLTGVFVPKATVTTLRAVQRQIGVQRLRVCALIETASAVLEIANIAGLPIHRLALGEVDLAADLGMSPSPNGRELDPLRLDVVVASAACDRPPPIGPVWIDIRDLEGLATSTTGLRRRGFGARQAIHPNQVEVINHAMSPTPQEIEKAASLIEFAARAGGGACTDESGRMIDEAVLQSARRLLKP